MAESDTMADEPTMFAPSPAAGSSSMAMETPSAAPNAEAAPSEPAVLDSAVVASPGRTRRLNKRALAYALLALLALAGGWLAVKWTFPYILMDASVYDVYWHVPTGWHAVQKSPLTLFLYRHPSHNISIRGFQYHVESEVAVDPSLDADGLATYYLETTSENLKNWDGRRIEDEIVGDLKFALVERWRKGKVVYTAYAVRGNTTIGASLYGGEGEVEFARENLPFFRQFLRGMSLKPTDGRGEGHELPESKETAAR